ncbi:MAG: hypothetical protein ABJ004_01045 [Cyclobacteriaceae bacterium]
MRIFIITGLLGLLFFSCSTNKQKEQTTSEPTTEVLTPASTEPVKSTVLKINPELTGNSDEHRTFQANSELTIIPVESYEYDLDSDGQLDKIELFNFEEYSGDPGDFQRIRIKLANGKVLDEYNLGIRANDYMPTQNEIESDLISIIKFGNINLLMTYGWYFASDPSELTIFEFSTGEPRRIFAQNFGMNELILKDSILLNGYSTLKSPDPSGPKPILRTLKIVENKLELTGSNNPLDSPH